MWKSTLLWLTFSLSLMSANCGPGTIYYRKPTKLVYYKKYPPALIYPKKTDYIRPPNFLNKFQPNAIIDNEPHKYGKYLLLNPKFLEYLIDFEEKPSWTMYNLKGHNAGSYQFNVPVFSYYPTKYHSQHINSDIKPVVEHIEDDLKYDFRTKTHSYDR